MMEFAQKRNRPNYLDFTGKALDQKMINIADVDTALRRKFAHFVALGELDGPQDVPYQRLGAESVDTTAHRLLALSAAEQAMTLLKNDPPAGSSTPLLPLNGSEKIALIGPQANYTLEMLSNYAGQNTLVLQHSPLMAAQAAGLHVVWTPGHSLNLGVNDKSHISDAVAAAKAADVAVVMVGLCADKCDNGKGIEDEGYDRDRLALPGAQEQL